MSNENLIAISFNYPKDIKRAIYTTIESLNFSLSKVIRNMSIFRTIILYTRGMYRVRKTPTAALPLMEKSNSALLQTVQHWSKSRSETSGQSNRMLAAMQRLDVARQGKARTQWGDRIFLRFATLHAGFRGSEMPLKQFPKAASLCFMNNGHPLVIHKVGATATS